MSKRLTGKGIRNILTNTIKGFGGDKIAKLSASLAYCMLFSMGPLIVMIIFLCSIFLGRDAIEGKIYGEFQNFLGRDVALQLQQMIKSAFISGKNTLAAITGGVTLLLGATSIFGEVQDSINQI